MSLKLNFKKGLMENYEVLAEGQPIGRFTIAPILDNTQYYLCNVRATGPKGSGTKMMRDIVGRFNDKPIALDVLESNKKAIHLYEKFGFKSVYFWSNQNDETYIEMIREVK